MGLLPEIISSLLDLVTTKLSFELLLNPPINPLFIAFACCNLLSIVLEVGIGFILCSDKLLLNVCAKFLKDLLSEFPLPETINESSSGIIVLILPNLLT